MFKTLKDLEYDIGSGWITVHSEIILSAIKICAEIKKSENGQIEIDGYIFTEEHTRLLKWFLNIEEKEIDDYIRTQQEGGGEECRVEQETLEELHPGTLPLK